MYEKAQGTNNWVKIYLGNGGSITRTKSSDGGWNYQVEECIFIDGEPDFCSWSNIKTVTVEYTPSTPGSLGSDLSTTTGSYTINWAPSTGNNVKHKLYENDALVQEDARTNKAFSNRNDGTYVYKVNACNLGGCSSFTNTKTATVFLTPSAPANLSYRYDSTDTEANFTLSWSESNGTVDVYQIDSNGSAFATTSNTAYTITSKPSGVYRFKVFACNSLSCSDNSNEITVKVNASFPEAVVDAQVIELPVPESHTVGSLSGSGKVTAGKAQYTISMPIPPGRSGVQPNVGLSYNSTAGNGAAGVGWSIDTDASSVYRCPRIAAIDGENSPIEMVYSKNNRYDRLCWKGERLMLSSGQYGRTNSSYVTEINNFSKVELLGGDIDNASAYFKVSHKSGLVEYYGGSSNATHTPTHAVNPLAWHLRKQIDRDENTSNYYYNSDPDQKLLLLISYTGNDDTDGNRRVAFDYTGRDDASETYYLGYRQGDKSLLRKIESFVGNEMVSQLELSYELSSVTARSLLASAKLCADAACSDNYPETIFEYTTTPVGFTEQRESEILASHEGDRMRIVEDFDGDGTRDRIHIGYGKHEFGVLPSNVPVEKWLYLSSDPNRRININYKWNNVYGNANAYYSFKTVADFNKDGKADTVGYRNGALQIGSFNNASWEFDTLTTGIAWKPGDIVRNILDFDRDGDSDLFVSLYPSGNEPSKYRIYFNCGHTSTSVNFCEHLDLTNPPSATAITGVDDINGDGLPDFIVDRNSPFSAPSSDFKTKIRFASMDTGELTYQEKTLEELGGPETFYNKHTTILQRRWLDINGDGLNDIFEIRAAPLVYINTGDGFEARTPDGNFEVLMKRAGGILTLDYDGDGRQDLLVPSSGDPTKNYCHFYLSDPNDDGDQTHCGRDQDDAFRPFKDTSSYADDWSVYPYDVVRFNLDSAGNLSITQSATNLELPLHHASVLDYNGDGLSDISFRLGRAWGNGHDHEGDGYVPLGYWTDYSVGPDDFGAYVMINTREGANFGIDLLKQSQDGLERIHQWQYSPLSGFGSSECSYSDEQPFYQVDRTQASEEHFHFNSSMTVVSESNVSNGIGGLNSTCYRYEDAMYSDNGRGFQGFKAIFVDENFSDVDNNKSIRTEFHDTFPLTGKPFASAVNLTTDSINRWPIAKTQTTWKYTTRNNGSYFVYRELERKDSYDLQTRRLLTIEKDYARYDSGDDLDYGNVSYGYKRFDTFFAGLAAITNVSEFYNAYDYSYATNWWIDKLDKKTRIDRATVYNPSHAPGPQPNAESNDRKVVIIETPEWYVDGENGARKPKKIVTQRDVENEESTQTFVYNGFGQPISKTVSAPNVTPRTTSSSYTEDGYFLSTSSNAFGHMMTFDYLENWGVLAISTDPEGIVTDNDYDNFGRLLRTRTGENPWVNTVTQWCDNACPTHAISKSFTVSDGTPIVTNYLDQFGRVLKSSSTGFASNPESVVVTHYDHRGRKVSESQLSDAENGAFFTNFSGFDPLGRYTVKTVDRSGHTVENQTWTYQYDGNTTNITLPGGQLTASRTYDARGLLFSTTDANSSTSYFRHDGLGNQILIQDVDGNQVAHYFDRLGRNVKIEDPDSGTLDVAAGLTFYNGLGEVISLQDANGAIIRIEYDELSRPLARYIDTGSGEQLDASWSYDEGKIGTLTSMQSGDSDFQESYQYDDLLRLIKTTTTIDGQSYETEIAYDQYYGRKKAMKMPSGEVIGYQFDTYGYWLSEYDPTTIGEDFLYYEIEEMDARGNVTTERFGNGLVGQHRFYASTGMIDHVQVGYASTGMIDNVQVGDEFTVLQEFKYHFDDEFGNLSQRDNVRPNGTVSETFSYDNLQRLASASRHGETVDYDFDAIGNLLSKADFGATYHYGDSARASGGNAGPHAVRQVDVDSDTSYMYSYDNNGNLLTGQGRSLTYTPFNKPRQIVEGGITTRLAYAPDLRLYKRQQGSTTIHYVGAGYEKIISNGSNAEMHKSYLSDHVVVETNNYQRKLRYLHYDRLKSVTAVSDESGGLVEEHGYDAFGAPLNSEWQSTDGVLHSGEFDSELTERGFTGHKHFDHHKVIHMGGRLYDPLLGRFFSVDPFIQNPKNTQSQNAYSYVMNNPLSGVDPTGYTCEGTHSENLVCDEDGEPNASATASHQTDNGKKGQTSKTSGNKPQVMINGKPSASDDRDGNTVVEGAKDVLNITTKTLQMIDAVVEGPGQLPKALVVVTTGVQVGEVVLDAAAPNPAESDIDREVKGARAGMAAAGVAGILMGVPQIGAPFVAGVGIGTEFDNATGASEWISDMAHDSEALNADRVVIKKSDHERAWKNARRRAAANDPVTIRAFQHIKAGGDLPRFPNTN